MALAYPLPYPQNTFAQPCQMTAQTIMHHIQYTVTEELLRIGGLPAVVQAPLTPWNASRTECALR